MPRPTKRTTLEVLTVKRLASVCDAFELPRTGLTRKDDLVDLIAHAKRAGFAAILDLLSRQELKQICRAHELDDSGKESAKIAARILGDSLDSPSVRIVAAIACKPKARSLRETNGD